VALELIVVTPEGEALCEEIEQVVLPGEAGDFGVLESHERFLTPLRLGVMQVVRTSGTEWAALSNGFAEVDGSRVVVLVDSCLFASSIDRDASETRRVDADNELVSLADVEENAGERARLLAIVARAEIELDVVTR
jgi:F-type H+-transporting ATPase subunit epsilon